MKRLLLFLMLLIGAVITMDAQKLYVDKVNSDGSRDILTEYCGLCACDNRREIVMFSLCCIQLQGVNYYSLNLRIASNSKLRIDKGRKLLIKFSDGSVLELENSNQIGAADYTYKVYKWGTTYYMTPYYDITEEQIQEIASKEAVKIRIEYNLDNIDGEIKHNDLSKNLGPMYDKVKEALATEKDVYSDF